MKNSYLERVDFRHRLLATILLVAMCEEHDVLAHSFYIRIVLYNLIVLQLRVQDRSAKETLAAALMSPREVHTGCGERLLDACGVGR